MDQGWLDSLSEDWESQPRSAGSPVPSLPSLTDSTSESSSAALHASRIPKYNPEKKTWSAQPEKNNSPLSERNLNDNNVPLSIRSKSQSKLRQDISASVRGGTRQRRRTLSDSATNSSQYGTIQRKADPLSQEKASSETPEWKRRLLQGDVAYGEQRDLFTAAGLEDMFRPPPTMNSTAPINLTTKPTDESSVVMPSSPPPYNIRRTHSEEGHLSETQKDLDGPRDKQPRIVKYRMMDGDNSGFSSNELSRSSSFQPRPSVVPNIRDESSFDSTPQNPGIAPPQNTYPVDAMSRVVSGQSDFRNEELSPIFISKQNTVSGSLDFVANLATKDLQESPDDSLEDTQNQVDEDAAESSQLVLGNASADTDDFAHNGKFVNLRRGGRSEDGSFQQRMLSPSSLPAIDESDLLPEESMQASTPKNLAFIKKTRTSNNNHNQPSSTALSPIPQTPETSPSKKKKNENSSGSPLKLFGTYDTFTNQTLLRRLSQFEKDDEEQKTSKVNSDSKGSSSDDVFATNKSNGFKRGPRKVNSFGAGELDSFQFSEEMSFNSDESRGQIADVNDISLPMLKPDEQPSFKFQLQPSPAIEDGDVAHRAERTTLTKSTKRRISIHTTRTTSSVNKNESSQVVEILETPRKRVGNSEGKRLPRSPFKDPTPKRRRTLHKSDLEESIEAHNEPGNDSLRETHHQIQSVIGKKRKDARHGDDQQAATPKVLAMRQMLRPRSPTPNQKLNQESKRLNEGGSAVVDRATLLQQEKIARIQAELDSNSLQNIPSILAANQQLLDGNRKPSLNTQDFLDEAKMIMGYIRTKAQAPSGLASVEESESEAGRIRPDGFGDDDSFEDSYESTREPFSRPPSRDGAPVQRLPLKQADPELLNHLRKYQEKSDIDDIIASSIRTIAQAKASTESLKEEMSRQLNAAKNLQSETANNPFMENSEFLRKRKHSSSVTSNQNVDEVEYPSHGSNSSGRSTVMSIPTGSSRGSDSRRIIEPHTVSHLIPEQVAGMIFDRERNMWVKRKSVSQESEKRNFLPSDDTDEDPFGGIPDLSVDETQEMQRLKGIAAELQHTTERIRENHARNSQAEPNTASPSPTIRETKSENPVLPTIFEQTSASEERVFATDKAISRDENDSIAEQHAAVKAPLESVEVIGKEISIVGDYAEYTPHPKRNATITFSSPLVSVIPPNVDFDTSSQSEADHQTSDGSQEEGDSVIVRKVSSRQVSTSVKTRSSSSRKSSRHDSMVSHKFSTRPVSRIDERDESGEESDPSSPKRSVSVMVATPLRSKQASGMMVVTPRPSHDIGTLTLTPMSEFTIHHDEEELGLNVSYVANNKRHSHGTDKQKTLSLVIKNLVEKLTEVEPYEPFWEHMKEIDLRDKKLSNLHKLDEFCENLEEIDASNNQISQLDGVARSVRHLRISYNCLTDLTAWGHLSNLQYVDVSNNELESLSAFKHLYHLRGIRADNNMVTSIDGIGKLNALLSLRLRGNLVEKVDFKNTELHKLTDLDLTNNMINAVLNLNELSSLCDLNLSGNKLDEFCPNGSKATTAMKYIRLDDNNLEEIDLSLYTNLRLLSVDRNRLGKIRGLHKATHLDTLSLREQDGKGALDLSFLSEAYEVRRLFLSGNFLETFNPVIKFLNLQYLELASCGLHALPANLGQMICNTRVLNLNYNALSGISSLRGIVRLRKLHIVGNRLDNITADVETLSKWRDLISIDMRCNPSTLGFYPPASDEIVKRSEDCETLSLFILAKANVERDTKYTKCLDMRTKMVRRAFELLVTASCKSVRTLNGLHVDRIIIRKRDDVFKGLVKIGIVADSADGADSGRDDENSTPRSQKTADHKQSRDSVKSSRQARVRQTDSASRDASTVRKSSSQTERSESTQTTQSSPFSPRSVRGGKASASAAGMSTQKPREKSAIWGAEDSFA